MATTHGSFDGSRLGAFVKSRLGVRNRPRVLVLSFIDESTIYSEEPTTFRADLDEYEGRTRGKGFIACCHVNNELDPNNWSSIHPGGPFPSSIPRVLIRRSEDGINLAALNELIPLLPQESFGRLIFSIDESGSMNRDDVGATIDYWTATRLHGYALGTEVVERSYDTEDWIGEGNRLIDGR